MKLAVKVRYFQGIQGEIAGIEIGETRLFHRECDRDSTTTSTNISHERHLSLSQFAPDNVQSGLHKRLRLWSRNEHTLIHKEIEAVKFFVSSEISNRLSLAAPLDQREKLLGLFWRNLTFRIGIERAPLNAQHVPQ
jgi:hypothetical protein